jgi:hypothetical protein
MSLEWVRGNRARRKVEFGPELVEITENVAPEMLLSELEQDGQSS